MIQTRHKEMLRLNNNYQDETTQQDVQNKILRSADVFINCLHGDPHLLTINQPYIHSIRKYTDKYQTFQFPNTFNQPRRSIA